MRLPGTFNHKTDPPTLVRCLPWTGSAWNPDDLGALLGVDQAAPAWPHRPVCVAAEQPPHPLPPTVLGARDDCDVADRSKAHHRLVGECREAGLTRGQTLAVVSEYSPSREKYGDRLPDEVGRSWDKVRSDTVLETGGACYQQF